MLKFELPTAEHNAIHVQVAYNLAKNTRDSAAVVSPFTGITGIMVFTWLLRRLTRMLAVCDLPMNTFIAGGSRSDEVANSLKRVPGKSIRFLPSERLVPAWQCFQPALRPTLTQLHPSAPKHQQVRYSI